MSLGAQEVTPLEQAVAYAAIANGGLRMEPHFITRIEDASGSVIYQHVPRGRRAIKATTAAWVSEVLSNNVVAGTGRRAQLPSGQPSAGKTGNHRPPMRGTSGFLSAEHCSLMGHPEEGLILIFRRDDWRLDSPRAWGAYMTRALQDEEILPSYATPAAKKLAIALLTR